MLSQSFFVRAYCPYIVDFEWELNVPADSQEDAISKVAAIMRDEHQVIPKKWVKKSGYDNDGMDIPYLHGKTGWEVLDKYSNDETSAKPDTSNQRAFVWSADYRNIAKITRADTPCIPHVGHDKFGVLIAEKVSEPSTASHVWLPGINAEDLSGGVTGQQFFCPQDKEMYRVLWSFTNPQ